MKVAVLSDGYPPWDRGGAQKIAAQLAEGYRERGHEVRVVTGVTDRSAAGRTTAEGVEVRKLWTPKPRSVLPYLTLHNPLVVGKIERALDAFDPDVVHTHNTHYLSNAALRAAARRAPVVKTYHDAGTVSYGELTGYLSEPPRSDLLPSAEPESDESSSDEPRPGRSSPPEAYRVSPWGQFRREGFRYNPLRNHSNRRTHRRHVERGVAVSDALRTALRANGMACHRTIHNGVDAAGISDAGDPAEFRAAYDLGDAPFVLFGGRTGYNKGGAHLARAFGEIGVRDAKLVVTGDDGYVSRMRNLAGAAVDGEGESSGGGEIDGSGDRIVTTGWLDRDRLCGALRAATVVATPSVHLDPFPTLNLEAFAAGTSVVTSRFGGASELVADGEDGFVVDPFDVSSLVRALESLLADPNRAVRFGERGREKVRREFTVEEQVETYLELFRSVYEH